MKLLSYYHIYLTEDYSWSYMFLDQLKAMHDFGLFERLDEFNISAIGTKEQLNCLGGLLNSYSKYMTCSLYMTPFLKTNTDEELNQLDTKNLGFTETNTIKMIWDRAKNTEVPLKISYFHSKGITAIERVLKAGDYNRFINYHYWRKFMDWSVIEKNEDCIKFLDEYDAVGANYTNWPCPHFSGNYWWANSDYLKTLVDPFDESWWPNYRNEHSDLLRITPRVKDEMWIGSGKNVKIHSLFNHYTAPPVSNLAENIILRKEYDF